ncbi:serine hydrolase [uncultured Microscilla sp.]|uniref:serine hydrolase domain-containing protein n=1 Tax=uncultured Microscilla sp. TaxID=432653 RepID=UPI00262BF524|nr:serine hydrolase domain-containing protein [uncultured Microscilla sp.]
MNTFIDQLFAQFPTQNAPGLALAVIQKGQCVLQQNYGLANLAENTAISSSTVFDIGSTAKQFTAACVALLIENGDLNLEDNVQTFVSNLPDYDYPLQIKHLIYHTSGLKDYLELAHLRGMDEHAHYNTAYALQLLLHQPDLNFVPGDEERYSNSNYLLLGYIVAQVSGQSLREFAHQHIFEPLGMHNTHFHDYFAEITPHKAVGYLPDPKGGYQEFTSKIDVVGDGGLYTTIEDLIRWDQNFYDNQLGEQNSDLIKLMTTPGRLNDDTAFEYGFGLILGKHQGKTIQRHGGAFAGYCAELLRFPEEKLSVIILANLATLSPWTIAEQVAEVFLGNAPLPPVALTTTHSPATPALQLPKELLTQYTGGYDLGAATPLEVIQEAGQLLLKYGAEDILQLTPQAEGVFTEPEYNIIIEFKQSKGARVPFMVFKTPDQEIIAAKVPISHHVDVEMLKPYTGSYYCATLKVVYDLFVTEKGLQLSIDFSPPFLLHLTDTDFAEGTIGSFRFFRNNDHSIREFTLNTGRADYLQFIKL